MDRLVRAACLLSALVSAAALGAAADPKLVAGCDACHGPNGVTASQDVPSIAGVPASNIIGALKAYRAKTRPCPPVTVGSTKGDMCTAAKSLSDGDIDNLADHYSSQKYMALKQSTDASKAAAGQAIYVKSCKKCHSTGKDPGDEAGILAGQPLGWLKASLELFRKGQVEQSKKMKEATAALSDADIEALAHFLASQ
jgi:sulfide dehydrogenase cytochrome subunit